MNMKDYLFVEAEEPPPVKTTKKFSYNAKVCTPEWFLTAEQPADRTDAISYLKFRADLFFKKKQYWDAYHEYLKVQEIVPPKNAYVLADIIEAQVRCLVHIPAPPKDPVTLAKTLLSSSKSEAQIMNCLLLLQYVYDELGMVQDEITMLQKILMVHHQNGDLWMKLAKAYRHLFKLDTSDQTLDCDITSKMSSTSIESNTGSGSSEQVDKPCNYLVCISSDNEIGENADVDVELTENSTSQYNNETDSQHIPDVGKTSGSSDSVLAVAGTFRKDDPDNDVDGKRVRQCDGSSGVKEVNLRHELIGGNRQTSQVIHSGGHSECLGVISGMPGKYVTLIGLLRARKSFLCYHPNLVGLAKERSAWQLQLVEREIQEMDVSEIILPELTKIINTDLTKIKENVNEVNFRDGSFRDDFERTCFPWPWDVHNDCQMSNIVDHS